MKKTIMIIGGGLLQVPVIQTAQKMGLQVIVTDYNPNAIGMKHADIPIVMSTRDIDGSVRVARSQNELTPIHAVLTAGTDASMTVAAVANALDLPGIKFDDAEAATNKIRMRMRLTERQVPCPKFLPVWSLADAKRACGILKFPVVIKPADNMGARGVTRIESRSQISEAFKFAKSASPSGELIIEEYMEGPELSLDAVIHGGEITITGVADRIIEYPPYFVETGHTMPSHLPKEMQDAACEIFKKGIRALGIDPGCAKGDIKITEKGAMVGEIAARLSGGFMSAYTYPLSSGVNLLQAAIEVALGQEPGNLEPLYHRVSIERAIIAEPGIVRKITGLEEALKVPGVKEIFMNVKPGDRIIRPRSNVEKAGHIIAVADTLEQAEAAVKRCKELLQVEVHSGSEISAEAINLSAREKLRKFCYVCKNCDGKDCPSGVPGMGGIGTGSSFRSNIEALRKYKINTRLIHGVTVPDTSTTFFGQKLSFPVMAAPITGMVTNMGGAVDELEYNRSVVKGCMDAGTIAFVGDGATPEKFRIGIQALEEHEGMGVPVFKPRSDNREIITRIRAAEKARAIAVGMDIDALVFKTMAMKNQSVGPKSIEDLKELISSTEIPFILKGIMNVRDAELAVEAGAHAIIISNHGGRVLDEMAGSMDVIEEIVREVKGRIRILIDGGFRTGVDVLKALAMGADAVLIGRPVAIAAVGMGANGVSFYLNTIRRELEQAMILTGCKSTEEISSEIVKRNGAQNFAHK